MNTEIYLDTPIEKNLVVQYNRFKIKNIEIRLNSTAKLYIIVFKTGVEFGNSMISKTIEMTEDEYNLWGTDDNYIIDFVKSRVMGLILD